VKESPNSPVGVVVCPACKGKLGVYKGWARCRDCKAKYERNQAGYLQFPVFAGGADEACERLEGYAAGQESSGERFYRDFLRPFVVGEPVERILDAGCGTGAAAENFEKDGFEAYGIDLPKASRFWKEAGRSPDRYVVGDVERLPFADSAFDVVTSIGVIEHVGTVTGHCTLAPDFRERRRGYASELVRVTRPGGRILIACPNKSFPLDLHHGPLDEASRPSPMRRSVHRATGLNVHRTWGDYHLISFAEVRRLFCDEAGARSVRPVSARGYFAYGSLPEGPVRKAAKASVEWLPSSLRASFVNPFVIAEIRR
jgi:SAM-dependent methyltransferase